MVDIVDFPELQEITGYVRSADIQKCLRRQGIKCFEGRVGTWTTIGLIESAGLTSANTVESDDVDIL